MLAEIGKKTKRMVLFYVRGKFQFPLARPLIEQNPDVDFYVHSNLIPRVDYESSELAPLANCHFVLSFDDFKYKLSLFGAFVTTDAQAATAHQYSLRLIRLFNRMGVPVLELQHGLFQLGLHYYDVPAGSYFGGDSLPTRTFADEVLFYYPPWHGDAKGTVIGYPPSASPPPHSSGEEPCVLVLSNMHWPTYQESESRNFYLSVFKCAEERPDENWVWKLHPSEIKNRRSQALIEEAKSKFPVGAARIRFHHLDPELGRRSLSDLVGTARLAISSVSTTLLDCELGGLRVAVFDSPAVKCLVDRLHEKTTFCDADGLLGALDGQCRVLKSGLLVPYDNDAFRRALDLHYRETGLPQSDFLGLAFDCMQPLATELRGGINTIRTELAHAVDEVTGPRGKLKAIQDAHGAQMEALKGLRTESAGLRDGLSHLSAESGRLREAMLDQTKGNERFAEEIRRRTDELVEMRGKLSRSEQLGDDLQRQLKERAEAVESLRGQMKEQTEAVASLHGQLKELAETVASLRGELKERAETVESLRGQLEQTRRAQSELQTALELEKAGHSRTRAQVDELRRKSLVGRIKRAIAAILPYGFVCMLQRRAGGSTEEKPLFYYPGFMKRMKRLVKFALPYGVVKLFRTRKYGN